MDIRPKDEFDIDHVPGAFALPFYEFFENPEQSEDFYRDSVYILYGSERYSKRVRLVARQLGKLGFENIHIMFGGYIEWLDRGYSTESGGL